MHPHDPDKRCDVGSTNIASKTRKQTRREMLETMLALRQQYIANGGRLLKTWDEVNAELERESNEP